MRNTCFAVVAFSLCFPAGLAAQGPPSTTPGGAAQSKIDNAIATNGTLHVVGRNLCTAPTVALNGAIVPASNTTATSFNVSVAGVAPGSYLLTVSCGNAANQNDAFDVTLGAVGLQGPQGIQGLPGPQGPQGPPGPTATGPTQHLVDATSKVIGEVLKLEGVGLSNASIKYPLATGDFVILSSTTNELTTYGAVQPAPPLPPPPAFPFGYVWFKEADCSGDAYVIVPIGSTPQFTRHQAIVLDFFNPLPPTGSACSFVRPDHKVLYVADSLSPLYDTSQPGNAITFLAQYGTPSPPSPPPIGCSQLLTPVSFPGSPMLGCFTVYTRVIDLTATFTPPFFIQ